jgi:hypothetical protein
MRKAIRMEKQKKQPVKWHVYELRGYYHALSDTDLAKMGGQQRAEYKPVKLGFDTDSDAMAFMTTIAGQGRAVTRNKAD